MADPWSTRVLANRSLCERHHIQSSRALKQSTADVRVEASDEGFQRSDGLAQGACPYGSDLSSYRAVSERGDVRPNKANSPMQRVDWREYRRGCGRRGNGELHRFLQIASGSVSELDNHFLLARDLGFLSSEEHAHFASRIIELRKMLAALIAKVDLERNAGYEVAKASERNHA